VIDFGSQYTHLISRRVRELGVKSEIIFPFTELNTIKKMNPDGIILSGGPNSVYDKDAPRLNNDIWNWILEEDIPVLGLCYGLHLIAKRFNGEIGKSKRREYGVTSVTIKKSDRIFEGLEKKQRVWMSHGDKVLKLPENFEILASSENCRFASFRYKNIYALQWHPEVVHTENGMKMLNNFLFKICRCEKDWDMEDFMKKTIGDIRKKIGDKKAIIALSGGVDSSIAAVLTSRAIGKNLTAVFVDTGLLRKNEGEHVEKICKEFKLKFLKIDAKDRFFEKLKGVKDTEMKRKIIGEEFIRIFEKEAKKENIEFLIQGTIYPDVIESGSKTADTIKSHHNVGGLPENVDLEIIEPLAYLYKDEVREIGKKLGIPNEIINQHPFPGPGLAVRITGEVNEENIKICREASYILEEELKKAGVFYDLWQAFAVVLEDRVVGVVGDQRKYGRIVALRIVESKDAMTANFAKLNWNLLEEISTKITNELPEVVSVAYFISNKPPQTIEPC
ncbi:MAG TPA: glutamine-hydrolyzing GMP synthase, partial [Methanomicrobia archaeon]|nr:glutamine-hydrolyzing GMP synthase [Methanomicrobia archaeon]